LLELLIAIGIKAIAIPAVAEGADASRSRSVVWLVRNIVADIIIACA
jgi:hypothetical protein